MAALLNLELIEALIPEDEREERVSIVIGKFLTELEGNLLSEFEDVLDRDADGKLTKRMEEYTDMLDEDESNAFEILLSMADLSREYAAIVKQTIADTYNKYFREYFPQLSQQEQAAYIELADRSAEQKEVNNALLDAMQLPKEVREVYLRQLAELLTDQDAGDDDSLESAE